MSEKLFLIDGMAMVYRAYFSMISKPLINSKGHNTSAVYGFLNSIIRILEEENPNYIAVCFDTEALTFRHKEFSSYKSNRFEMPTDMPWQINILKQVIKALNIPLIEVDGYEADDIIGTLVKRAEKEKVVSYMVTPDKDFMQLVSDKTFLYKPQRNIKGSKISDVEIINIEGVKNKFGVGPAQVIDILGLMGDTSDNIPGVKGVGEKTAITLIQKYNSIENLYEKIDTIDKEGLKTKLVTSKTEAFLSKKLATIDINVPLNFDFHSLKRQSPDNAKLVSLLNELEFKSLIKKFSAKDSKGTTTIEEHHPDLEWPPKEQNGDETTLNNSELKSSEKKVRKARSEMVISENNDLAKIKVEIPLSSKPIKTISTVSHNYYTIKSNDQLLKLAKKLSEQALISFDTETDGMDSMNTNLVGMSFSFHDFEAFYIPIINKNISNKANTPTSLFDKNETKETKDSQIGIDLNFALEKIKPILESRKIKKVGQNIKFDYLVMRNYGIEMENIFFDSLIGAYVIHSEGNHDMDSLSEKFLNYKPIPIVDLIGKGRDKITMDQVQVEKISEYAAEDADVTLQLYHRIKFELEKLNLYQLCTTIEFPLIKVLAEMEFAGVKVNEKILDYINRECEKLILEYETKIYNIAGEKFNINSTKQLSEILFTKLKLSPVRKTKTGYSTDVLVLEELKYQHEIASVLVDYRTLTKLKSTYLEGLKKAINPKTKRVHTSFNQIIAATGRLSSVNPNLQNIPIRTEVGRSIRKAFVAKDKDYFILSADYSQIELRIMAHYCEDENMISAFKHKHDIHTETAMRVFNLKSQHEVTPNQRRKAKEVNFGIIYGIGAFGLAKRLEIKNTEAKSIIDKYFQEYPKVKEYTEKTLRFAREFGYVESLMGRRRYLPQINNQNPTARSADERAAINMPIQGTAADMIKIAMIMIFNDLKKHNLESKMILQVHDELVFDVKKSELEKIKEIVSRNMKNAIKLKVPIEIEIGIGESWFDTH